ncbi:MoxR family ATPase [Dactylosporangium sp. NPDC051485]|uniref:AAA family ATPase n=1 Tax=Dactylosporangium sp. NPDC051485 TaxID=3154846 RepID=UPI00343007EF
MTEVASFDPRGREDVASLLRSVGYLADTTTAATVLLAERLGKPVLVEGPAGTGKTELAKSFARMTGRRLIRLQCYEGLDEAKALYEWNYRKQLLGIQGASGDPVEAKLENVFGESYLIERPLLEAIRAPDPVVLLIDEVDRLDVDTEALLLEVLAEFQVSIPELGTVRGAQTPTVFLTSNNSRDLSDALKRRCLFLFLGYPSPEREAEIIRARVPDLVPHLVDQVASILHTLRQLDLRKAPSVSETLDWSRTLCVLGIAELDADAVDGTLQVLLKYQSDIDLARKELFGRG